MIRDLAWATCTAKAGWGDCHLVLWGRMGQLQAPPEACAQLAADLVADAQVLSQRLSHVMLLAIEVAVEMWLGLQWTPQAQIMKATAQHSSLSKEVRSLPSSARLACGS